MVSAVTRGMRRIEADRKWEDYESMKKYFSSYHKKGVNEIIFDGFQVMTDTAAALEPSDQTIAFVIAQTNPFVSTVVADVTQALESLWVTYQTSAGVIKGPILHLINDDATTAINAPLGNEDVYDTCTAGEGTNTVTMTLVATENQHAGKYMITRLGAGIAELPNLIISNTAATPTVLTLTNASHAGAVDDIMQYQTYDTSDFWRVRQMYCGQVVLDTKAIIIENAGATAVYGTISKTQHYNSSPNYFSTDAAYARCFLGKIIAKASWESTDAKAQGNEIQVTFTPKAQNTNAAALPVIIDLIYQDQLDWQPCIELEPATDVTVKILTLDNTNVDDMYIQIHYLEARRG